MKLLAPCLATLALFTAACADEATDNGNETLGIASFSITESSTTTTVVGVDATGRELGRVELTHGSFRLSPAYREDYDTDVVDGRRLDATFGAREYVLERAGYEPLLHMPAFPASQAELAALLADPHVKPILDRWQLGFDTASAERAYDSYSNVGDLVQTCDGMTSCGSLTRTGTDAGTYSIGTCGGSATATTANRIAISHTTVDEVAQCCPSGSGGLGYGWWARKQCAKDGLATTDCGTVTAGKACIGCGTFKADYQCSVTYSGSESDSYYEAYLEVGATCWDAGTEYGACAPDVPCYKSRDIGGTGGCKYWEDCYCGGSPAL